MMIVTGEPFHRRPRHREQHRGGNRVIELVERNWAQGPGDIEGLAVEQDTADRFPRPTTEIAHRTGMGNFAHWWMSPKTTKRSTVIPV